jgi:catechol 2,3-dioxygenase-like lactoylglutathione lyase family enzyme
VRGRAISTVTKAHGGAGTLRRQDFLRRTAGAGLALGGAGAVLDAAAAEGSGRKGGSPLDRLGLHNRVNRMDRIVTNVSDLERAKAFWEAVTPLRAYAMTQAPRQSFRNLGISSGTFDGYLLRDPAGIQAFTVHLVEWKDPKPVGVPYKSVFNVGWYRLAFSVPDVEAKYDEVIAAGGRPYTEPMAQPLFGEEGSLVFCVPDPDGITVEFFPSPNVPQVTHIASTTTDVDGTIPFYRDVLGLDYKFRLTSCPVPNVYSPDGGAAGYDTTFFSARGDTRFSIDHLSWPPPAAAIPKPYDIFGQPTHLGFVRLSLEVDDIEAAYHALLRAGLRRKRKGYPRVSGPPEEWDFGTPFGTREVVVFTDTEGVGFELVQQAPYPGASLTSPPLLGPCVPPVPVPPQPDRM